jgi:DNA-binding NarL/FixJ family response regulator
MHDTAPIRTLVVTEICLCREGLCHVLVNESTIRIAGAASSPEEALARLAGNAVDVVVLDMTSPRARDMVRAFAAAAPGTKVIGFAVGGDEAELLACVESGLAGYIPRSGTTRDLVEAIGRAARGEAVCSPTLTASLFRRVAALSRQATDRPALSERETEILTLIDRGLSNKEIARDLKIGLATVKNHVHNILEKLRVRRRAEAAAQLRPYAAQPTSREI